MSTFRIQISHGLGSSLLKSVVGASNYTRELSTNDYGGFFWTRKLTGFVVTKRHDSASYNLLMQIENSNLRCDPVSVELRKYTTANSYNVIYTGEFSMNNCKFDLENCKIEIDSRENSIYTCIEKNKSQDFNMLSVEGIQLTKYGTVLDTVPSGAPNGNLEFTREDMSGDPTWFPRNINGPLGVLTFYFRAVAYTECIGGNPQLPEDYWPGDFDEWVALETCYDINEQVQLTKYVQSPAPAALIGIMATWMSYVAGCGDRAAAVGEFTEGGDCYTLQYNYGSSPNQQSIPNGRKLSAVLTSLFSFTVNNCTENTAVKSNFFCINPDEEYVSIHPVTGEFNYWKDPNLHEINDVKFPTASSQSSIQIITFEQLMRDLMAICQIVWWIEYDVTTYTLRIEHISTALSDLGVIDLSGQKGFRVYSYDIEKLGNRKRFATPAQRNIDFVGNDIFYEQSCTTDDVNEVSTQLICSDVAFIQDNPDDAPKSGIVIFAVDDFGKCRIRPGGITGVWQANSSFGWGALHKAFYMHEANTPNGNLSGETVVFLSTVRNKKQEISVKDCDFDAEQNVVAITELGTGIIKKISMDLRSRIAKLEINL